MDDFSVHPETLAGDGFAYASAKLDDTVEAHYAALERLESSHGCYGGWVFLGFEGEDADGNPCEVVERYPCRRCHGESR